MASELDARWQTEWLLFVPSKGLIPELSDPRIPLLEEEDYEVLTSGYLTCHLATLQVQDGKHCHVE